MAVVRRERAISWQARWVELLLRVTVKRRMAPDVDLAALRRHYEEVDDRKFRVPPDARRTAVDAAGVRCEWLDVPQSRPERVLLYLHGGGFVVRLPNLYARFAARVGRALGARVLLVDYRLAPEHPFPAAVDDCLATYRWLLGQGVSARNIVIAGDSAGGNLTLVTLLGAKAAGLPPPACAFVLSPPVDLTVASPSFVANERSDAMFRLATLILLRGRYVGAERLLDPLVSPLFGDLAGLPPLLLQAGTREVLRDDAVRFAERARSAGVEVELELWHDMQHCFQLLQFLPESGRAIQSIERFVARHTGWSPAARPRSRGASGARTHRLDDHMTTHMQKLSGQDALFLHIDRPHAATHATMVYVYDQSGLARPLRFRQIIAHLEERLQASPMYRRRIVQAPLGLAYPYWADDPDFDIDFHVRHLALPKPGDWRQFQIMAARIHARQLDLTRPPWEMYVIEGLDNVDWLPAGSFALITKAHHAAVDGTALAELTWALHDVEGVKGKPTPVLAKQPDVGAPGSRNRRSSTR